MLLEPEKLGSKQVKNFQFALFSDISGKAILLIKHNNRWSDGDNFVRII